MQLLGSILALIRKRIMPSKALMSNLFFPDTTVASHYVAGEISSIIKYSAININYPEVVGDRVDVFRY